MYRRVRLIDMSSAQNVLWRGTRALGMHAVLPTQAQDSKGSGFARPMYRSPFLVFALPVVRGE